MGSVIHSTEPDDVRNQDHTFGYDAVNKTITAFILCPMTVQDDFYHKDKSTCLEIPTTKKAIVVYCSHKSKV